MTGILVKKNLGTDLLTSNVLAHSFVILSEHLDDLFDVLARNIDLI